jgi:hypothetical protein
MIKNIKLTALSIPFLSLAITTPVMADDFNKTIEKALRLGQDDAKYGQIKFDLRFRYDNTDSANPAKQVANAFTDRLRLGYLTPGFQGFQAYAEYAGNQDIGVNTYNSTRNGKTQYETIADPQQNELSQLWLSYKGIPATEIKAGRQPVQFDNERFIGAAAWRQLQRTFDGVLMTNASLPDTTIKAGYLLNQQNTDATVHGMQTPVVNIAHAIKGWGTLSSYGYWFDDHDQRPQDSSQTYGVRFDGKRAITDGFNLLYTAEYAYQRDYVANQTDYQVDYYHLIGGFSAFGVTAKGAMEQLGGNGLNKTFDTPLGLLHRFNGWADLFILTPIDGLRDVYASVETSLLGATVTGMFHDFADDTGKQHYGDEWDFMVTKEFFKHYTLLAKYAYFHADADGAAIGKFDTQKIWLGAGIVF